MSYLLILTASSGPIMLLTNSLTGLGASGPSGAGAPGAPGAAVAAAAATGAGSGAGGSSAAPDNQSLLSSSITAKNNTLYTLMYFTDD